MHQNNSPLYQSFLKSPHRSIKHESYFSVYDKLLSKYIDQDITFVEIGILDGGSLFMWRDFLGDKARIIGIEINPVAKKWEEHGFEIFIGSQSNPVFWKDFYETVGSIDVLIDDGGHTYKQQIVTVEEGLENINNGGMIVVEDTYTSYQKEYGYPSKYNFLSYASNLVDGMNLRTPKIGYKGIPNNNIEQVSFFESIVAIDINSDASNFLAAGLDNKSQNSAQAISMRYEDNSKISGLNRFLAYFLFLKEIPLLGSFFASTGIFALEQSKILVNKLDNRKLKRYFRYK